MQLTIHNAMVVNRLQSELLNEEAALLYTNDVMSKVKGDGSSSEMIQYKPFISLHTSTCCSRTLSVPIYTRYSIID